MLANLLEETSGQHVSGLTSRRNLERAISAGLTRGTPLIVAVLDVDQFRVFKNLNGGASGEALLRMVSRRLDAAARAAGGQLARLGADEFAIVVPQSDLTRNAGDWTHLLLAETTVPFAHRGTQLGFSATLGFALLPGHGGTLDDALRCARLAVAQGKLAGGGVSVPCSDLLVREARGRDELARDLRGAIATGQIVPFYQPVVALKTGQIAGLEVLARWIHPERGVLLPAEFIPLAEEQCLCRELTLTLLRQTRHHARAWPAHWRFAFNTTPRDVLDLLSSICGTDGSGEEMIAANRIELEVTESAVMRDLTDSQDLLASFQPRGVKLVLDDFGTGYANFQQLRQIPFARLKIDKSFIVDMLDDPRAAACVHAIIQLAHHLDMTATAEGVELASIADRLTAMECDYAQGYHYARPMPAHDVARLIGQAEAHDGPRASGLNHAA